MAWYNYDRINSYNANFHMILTNRGYGKTFGAKKRAINNFIKKNEQFVYIRRYKTEFEDIDTFFDDIKNHFPEHTFEVKGKRFYINKKVAGYAIVLSTSARKKSVPYPLVTTLIYDEFIIDKGVVRYIPNEPELLMELISTIVRKRDNWRMYLLANNISTVNPYFKYFNVRPKEGERFTLFRDGVGIVEISTDDVFVEEMRNTAFGKLTANTKYSDYAIENKSLRDSNTFIEKIPLRDCTPLYSLAYEKDIIQVWICLKSDVFYCNSKVVEGTEQISLVADSHNENTILNGKKIKMSYIDDLIKQFQVGCVRFENQDVKQTVYSIFKKLGVR